eukprot:26933-Pyramimonas_sp.AAC.1
MSRFTRLCSVFVSSPGTGGRSFAFRSLGALSVPPLARCWPAFPRPRSPLNSLPYVLPCCA